MAVRKTKVKEQMDAAMGSMLEPGEHQIVAVRTIAGPSPWLAEGFLGLLWQFLVKYYYVVVTERRVLFIQYSRMTGRPKKLAFAEQRGPGLLVGQKVSTLWSWFKVHSSTLNKTVRLNVDRYWREEMTQVLAELERTPAAPTGSDAAIPPPPPAPPANA
jgi:hypothetical protein